MQCSVNSMVSGFYLFYLIFIGVGVGGLFFWSQCLDLGPHNEAPLQWIWHDELWFDTPTPPPTIHTHTIFLARLFFSDGWNWAEQNKLCVQSPISMKYYFFFMFVSRNTRSCCLRWSRCHVWHFPSLVGKLGLSPSLQSSQSRTWITHQTKLVR